MRSVKATIILYFNFIYVKLILKKSQFLITTFHKENDNIPTPRFVKVVGMFFMSTNPVEYISLKDLSRRVADSHKTRRLEVARPCWQGAP